ERAYSTAFTIGNNGYIGTGIDSTSTYQTSFWQYTDTTKTVVCSIHAKFSESQGSNGQVTFTSTSTGTSSGTSYAWDAGDTKGTGNGNVFNYTYTSNGTYSVKLSLTDNSGACTSDTSISITISNVVPPTCNLWTKMSDFTGAARDYGTSFTIGHYGFIGCGFNGSTYYNDFYKWNQTTNTWSAIANYPGAGYYYSPVGFTIEGKGYVGLGYGSSGVNKDLWMYDTTSNSWTQKASLPGTARYDAAWFVIGHKVYVIGGSAGGSPYLNDVWVYDAHTNTWKQLNSFPSSEIDGGVGFAIGNNGYVGGGANGTSATAFWKYDTTNDSWTSIASFPYSGGVGDGHAFVIGSRGFVCTGQHGGTYLNPVTIPVGYVYDTISKAWSEFTNMGANGNERAYSTAFTIGNNGYIGTGIDSTSTYQTSFWQYYPCADTAKAPVCKLHASFTSSLGNNGQVSFTNKSTGVTAGTKYSWTAGDSAGTGSSSAFSYTYLSNGTYTVNLSITDSVNVCSSDTAVVITVNSIVAPTCNLWTKMSNFTGAARDYGTSFTIGHYGFIGCGFDGSAHYNDFYKWNQATNTWSAIANYPGAGYYFSPIGFSIEGKGYVGLGGNTPNGGGSNDLWQYDTTSNSWTQKASLPGTARYDAAWFVIGHKVYVIGGSAGGSPYLNDVWVYDAHTNAWKQLKNSPAPGIDGMAAFTIGNHGYVGGGGDGSGYTSFWQYDTTNDSWTPIANYPGYTGIGLDARAFVIGSKAYLCTGGDGGTYLNPVPAPVGYVYDTISK
ncbi:MAG TPA: kelch repeat-containing protein, partial [Bacteroidia bacterium]|nr:kelch repeat-containing protein [Bacteroidia bacterium]